MANWDGIQVFLMLKILAFHNDNNKLEGLCRCTPVAWGQRSLCVIAFYNTQETLIAIPKNHID